MAQSAKVADRERPKRYYIGYWPEARSDEYGHWGGATYYFECLSSGYPTRQIEIYDNGIVLIYNEQHISDQFGMLSDKPIEPFHKELREVSVDDFEAIVAKVTTSIYNQ
ncbi:hypothetical protein SD80_012205 [Scytonema tolypothrichoides VB-61278]|nr:hypothetical protein SD80_012205 [Scytonema tolypothrichoides VB-61278]